MMKSVIKNGTKENIFGTQDRTPGQNLMRAVTNSVQPVGIPPYNYDSMLSIFRRTLEPDEVDLLCRGYGIGRERQSQKEISAVLNVDPNEISMRAHRAVKKLQASPFKTQLKELVPSLEELFATIEELRDSDSTAKMTKELEYRYRNTKALLEQSEDARKALEDENARLLYELEVADKKLKATESQLTNARRSINSLSSQVVHEKARAEAVKAAFDKTLEAAKINFAAAVANAEIKAGTLEELNLSESAMNALKRAGVHTLKVLCDMSYHSLSKLGVGSSNLKKIQQKLSENCLSLRVG